MLIMYNVHVVNMQLAGSKYKKVEPSKFEIKRDCRKSNGNKLELVCITEP